MSLTIKLYHNASPANKIGKKLNDELVTSDVLLKDDVSILKPVFKVKDVRSIITYNYLYCPDLQRYYFIDDIISVHNDLWEISCHVDVLETYKNGILGQTAVIKRQQNKYNLYLNDPDFMTYNNDTIQTKKFSDSAFTKTLSYVLVVNGS